MGGMVQSILCSRIEEAGTFSLLVHVDASKDRAKKEQLTIVLRCVDLASLDTEGLTQYIMEPLRKHQLDLACTISQGYDGASVMSGHCTGVQERLKARSCSELGAS